MASLRALVFVQMHIGYPVCVFLSQTDHAHTCSQELPVVKYKCYRLHIEPGMQQQQCVHARVVRDQDINVEPECEHVQLSEMQ